MNRVFAVACGVVLAAVSAGVIAGELKSGLEAGKSVPAFNVRDITGPSKGKSLCYRCKYGSQPVVAVFTRSVDGAVESLVKGVDEKVVANKDHKMAAFVVMLTSDADKAEKKLADVAKAKSITATPLTVFEGEAGPDGYNISKDAEVNVMMWVDGKVKVNKAFSKGELKDKDVADLVAETAKILE